MSDNASKDTNKLPSWWPDSWKRWLKGKITPEEVAKTFPEPPKNGHGYGGPKAEDGPVR